MFRVQFLCDDKRLGEVLQLISGKVHELTQQPVANVKIDANGNAQAEHSGTTVRDSLIPELLKTYPEVKKTGKFTSPLVGAVIEKLGGSSRSMTTHLSVLMQRKQIKRVGRGVYMIMKGR